MRVLVIDHVDSFVFNLVEELRTRECAVDVIRHHAPLDELRSLARAADAVVLSPGPGTPAEAPHSVALVRKIRRMTPVIGVCLGHQIIVHALGGHVDRAGEVVHGKTSAVRHDETGVFAGLPNPLTVGRYHSLVATRLPTELHVCAKTPAGLVMAVRHESRPLVGLQFHPESILTTHGGRLLDNFLNSMENHHASATR